MFVAIDGINKTQITFKKGLKKLSIGNQNSVIFALKENNEILL